MRVCVHMRMCVRIKGDCEVTSVRVLFVHILLFVHFIMLHCHYC